MNCFPQDATSARVIAWRENETFTRYHFEAVSQLNQLALHRRAAELRIMQRENESTEKAPVAGGGTASPNHSQTVLAARSTLTSALDGSHPMFTMVQTDVGRTLLQQAIFLEVTRNIANGEHLFNHAEPGAPPEGPLWNREEQKQLKKNTQGDSEEGGGQIPSKKEGVEKMISVQTGKVFSLLNLLSWDKELYHKGLEKVDLDVVVASVRNVTMELTTRVVAESCTGGNKKQKMDGVNEWLKIQVGRAGDKKTVAATNQVKTAERLLFDALFAIGDASRVMNLVQDSPNSVDANVMKRIFTSNRMPAYVLLFVSLYTPMANHRSMTIKNQVKDMSPNTAKIVRDWIGPLYHRHKQSSCENFSLKAAASRYYVTWAIRTSKRVRSEGGSLLYDCITGYNLHRIFVYLDCDIEA